MASTTSCWRKTIGGSPKPWNEAGNAHSVWMHCFLPPPSINLYWCTLPSLEEQTSQRWSTQGANAKKAAFPELLMQHSCYSCHSRAKEWQVPSHAWSRPQATAQPDGFWELSTNRYLGVRHLHINKTVQIIKMGTDAAKSSALQPSRDFVVWNVVSICMTCILETVNYIFLFVKEAHV